jgi:hypothetical protein
MYCRPSYANSGRCWNFVASAEAQRDAELSQLAAAVAKTGTWTLEIVKRNELHRFVALPKRWIVERTLAWISRNRRLACDFEHYARTVAAFIRLAMIRLMLRRLTKSSRCS